MPKTTETKNTNSKTMKSNNMESKQVKNTKPKTSNTKYTNKSNSTTPTNSTTQTTLTTPTNSTTQTNSTTPNVKHQSQENENTESRQRAGRTVIVKSVSGNNDDFDFSEFVGLVSQSETKTSNSYFLTFDTVDNAVNAFNSLKAKSNIWNAKFSYYRVFFTMEGLGSSTDYTQVKEMLSNWVNTNTGSNVLYCKFYRKNDNYLGCGDFTIDTMDGMNKLLSKDGGLKEFTMGEFTGTFYRYNSKKDKPNVVNSNV